MGKVEEKTRAKGSVVETIVSDTKGLTKEGERFLELYLARLDAGKALASAGAGLRALKSEETLCFWGSYAVAKTGFGGQEVFTAPPYNESVLRERLKVLGWSNKRLPSGQVVHCRKHKITLSAFEKAAYDQESAARKAAQDAEKKTIRLEFPPDTVKAIAGFVSDTVPLGDVIAALENSLKEYIRNL